MARMVPELLEEQLTAHNPQVEATVYRALRDSTPNDWLVFFNLRLVKQVAGLPREHGEVDFLLFAPEYGVLVVEVKGGVVEVDDAKGEWRWIDDRGRSHVLADPARQALAALKGVTSALRREMNLAAGGPRILLTGTALLFPDIVDSARLAGPGRPVLTVGGSNELASPASWILRAFEFWAEENHEWHPLGATGMAAAEQLFAARLFLARPLARVLAAEHARHIELTKQQGQVLRALKYTHRALISGAAGTGKTLLALQQAREYANQGRRTLFVCYNRALSDFLARECKRVKNLDAITFHMLLHRRLAAVKESAGIDVVQQARIERGSFADADRLDAYALARSTEMHPFRYQALVVDEGQDFAPEAFLAFRKLLEDRAGTPWIIFFDPNQAIYQHVRAMPDIGGAIYPLTANCRNTRYIHDASYAFFQGNDPADPCDVAGDPIELIEANDVDSQALLVRSKVEQLIHTDAIAPGEITVLVAGDPKEAFFKALHTLGNPRGTTWLFEQHWNERAVTVDTVRRFKGLEATIVILWGIEYARTDIARELLYVALSRARSRVSLVGHPQRVRDALLRCAVNTSGIQSLVT